MTELHMGPRVRPEPLQTFQPLRQMQQLRLHDWDRNPFYQKKRRFWEAQLISRQPSHPKSHPAQLPNASAWLAKLVRNSAVSDVKRFTWKGLDPLSRPQAAQLNAGWNYQFPPQDLFATQMALKDSFALWNPKTLGEYLPGPTQCWKWVCRSCTSR